MVRQTKVQLQAAVDGLFVVNTSGDIEADEVLAVMTDFIDSFEEETSVPSSPSFSQFVMRGQSSVVNPGTTIDGSQTFDFRVAEQQLTTGTCTLEQDTVVIQTGIANSATSTTATINSVTLTAGQTVDFTMACQDASSVPFDKTFQVRARTLDEYVYIGADPDGVPNLPVPGITNFSFPFAGRQQDLVMPTFTGNQHMIISQKASEPHISRIEISGLNQISGFTRVNDAYTVNSQQFDAYVSNDQLIPAQIQGEIVTIVR